MHTIGVTLNETEYTLGSDDLFYYQGLISQNYRFGELLIKYSEIDLNWIADKINYPITSVDDYLVNCQSALSERYDPYIISLMLNDIEQIIHAHYSGNTSSASDDLNDVFQNFALLQIITKSFVEKKEINFSVELLCSMQNFQTKFMYDNNSSHLKLVLMLQDIFSLMSLEISQLQQKGIQVKKCENCGKYFLPEKRTDEIYCDRIFKNNKTCKQIGYEEKVKSDPFKQLYTTARKTQHARIRYNSHIPDYKEKHFEPWKAAASEARDHFKKNNDIAGFKHWLNENKDSF